jgi:hypothetical protein
MPRVTWPLEHDRPVVHVQFIETASRHRETRLLLADTGAGGLYAPFELIVRASDCQRYLGLRSSDDVALGGAIIGTYPIYAVRVEIPALDLCMQCYIVLQSREKSNVV